MVLPASGAASQAPQPIPDVWYDAASNRWMTRDVQGHPRAAGYQEVLSFANAGGQIPAGVALPSRDTQPGPEPVFTTPNGSGQPATDPDPISLPIPATPPPPPSYDPPAGGPTYTPGMVFGQGQLPGKNPSGGEYQRNWFDVGPDSSTEALNNTYYNDPNNWQFAWDKVVNQFGGMPGGDFNKWLSNFSTQGRADFQNTVPYAKGTLNVSDFLDRYAPQIKGVYDLLPGQAKGRGGAMPLAGRSNY